MISFRESNRFSLSFFLGECFNRLISFLEHLKSKSNEDKEINEVSPSCSNTDLIANRNSSSNGNVWRIRVREENKRFLSVDHRNSSQRRKFLFLLDPIGKLFGFLGFREYFQLVESTNDGNERQSYLLEASLYQTFDIVANENEENLDNDYVLSLFVIF